MCILCESQQLSYGASAATADLASPVAATPEAGSIGPNFLASQTATSSQNINGVLSGDKWGSLNLKYSFPTLTSQYEAGITETGNNFGVATVGLQAATRYAMGLVSQYTNMTFSEVSGSTAADIRSAFSDSASPTAYAYYPGNYTEAGDIWYSSTYPEYSNPIKGQYGMATVIHELGHALGLKHGHETGGVSNVALDTAHDQMEFSIMTYRSYQGGPSTGYSNELNGYAQTYMMFDIAALQTMYGANFNTNSGNTTYRWDATTGEMSIDGVGQGAPGGNRIFMTLWDGNGNDTYDFSNYSNALTVDLRPGSYSITSATQIANLGGGHSADGNIFNALQFNGDVRSLIENAIGGAGNDTIAGNQADNTLNGGAGNDALYGFDGDDTFIGGFVSGGGTNQLWGGNGSDTADYSSYIVNITADLRVQAGWVAGTLNDQMNSIENATGGSGHDVLIGTDADNNVLIGNGGADVLYGLNGNDILRGGTVGAGQTNQLWGGNGSDTADYATTSAATIVDLRVLGTWVSGVLTDQMSSIENVNGGSGDDQIIGTDADANTLIGNDGTDVLYGLNGDDILSGGTAQSGQTNQLWGGTGNDAASYAYATTGIYVDLNQVAGWVKNGGGTLVLTDLYNSIENVVGGSVADTIVGDNGANRITGGVGGDILYANAGASQDAAIDTFVYTSKTESNTTTGYDVVVNFKTGQDKIDFTAFGTSAGNVLIQTSGGSTSVYANVDGVAGYDIALIIQSNTTFSTADILF